MSNQAVDRIKAHHTALCVSDFDRSKAFYCDGLGFEYWQEFPNVGGERIAMIRLKNGGMIELFEGGHGQVAEERETISGSYFQYCFEVAETGDVDKMYEYALSIGATSKIPPADYDMKLDGTLICRACFVYGPDGEILEFIRIPKD